MVFQLFSCADSLFTWLCVQNKAKLDFSQWETRLKCPICLDIITYDPQNGGQITPVHSDDINVSLTHSCGCLWLCEGLDGRQKETSHILVLAHFMTV